MLNLRKAIEWKQGSRLVCLLAVPALTVALASCAAGCTATTGVEAGVVYGYPAVSVATVPVDIQVYPRVYYRGSYAYLVGDRWYYMTPQGWVVFRREPEELARRRVYIVENQRRRPHSRYEERREPERPEAPVERGRRRYYPE